MSNNNSPIGVFDSGVGGISVLREMVKIMPKERFIFFGDSANAPYGVRPVEEIKELTFSNVKKLLEMDSKAIVVACNTATSAAVRDLRNTYEDLPIVGIEPALKPATHMFPEGRIAVMATPMTIKQQKFKSLMERFREDAEVIPVPCPGLMDYVESGELEGERLERYLRDVLCIHLGETYDGIVLGCTHYPFILKTLRKVVGDKPVIFDGAEGTAREIKRRIELIGLSATEDFEGDQVTFITTDTHPDSKIELMNMLFNV